jgi:hypothetical protein
MIPVGYMAKRVQKKPDWLKAPNVIDIYSVCDCVSKNFADYIKWLSRRCLRGLPVLVHEVSRRVWDLRLRRTE